MISLLLALAAPVLTLLWGLMCLRIYTMISRQNPVQRRIIAIGAGLGGALIYIVVSIMVNILKTPSEPEEPRIRIHQGVPKKA